MNTATCKQAIINHCDSPAELDAIADEFGGYLDLADLSLDSPEKLKKAVCNVKNWKRICKERGDNPGEVLRIFDCEPFDDQLRAYVLSRGDTIVSVDVVGE